MVDIGLILKLSLENYRKCESCKEYKTTKKTYKIVNRKSELLCLIHSDLRDFKNIMTRDGKRFCITLQMNTQDLQVISFEK